MKELKSLQKYFVRYRWRLLLGIMFVAISNVFAVLPPVVIRNILDQVYDNVHNFYLLKGSSLSALLRKDVIRIVMISGLLLVAFAILKGIFMFLMRQTIIVMSRHIEYDQKNEIYDHYQKLDTAFYKRNATGDLMSRISEDVSRVRSYTGPAIMYIVNLVVLTIMCLWNMFRVSPSLALYSIAPLPILALTIFYVNRIVNRKGERIQSQLSNVTTNAQENYSGIRVLKSFGMEQQAIDDFGHESLKYRRLNIDLSLTEAVYFPAMNLFIGISVLSTVLIGGWQAINGNISPGNIAEFVIYITMLTFPISAIGWTANMIQRAIVSQRRINEFLDTEPAIANTAQARDLSIAGTIELKHVYFTYPTTGIQALRDFSLNIEQGQKVCILGKTGSGKSTISHLLLRMYNADSGQIRYNGVPIQDISLQALRSQISYVPQEVFLFSDTIRDNIAFGNEDASSEQILKATTDAAITQEIEQLNKGFDTMIGERGVMLSGGQKQRISIARGLVKEASLLILDESLSAIDTNTEKTIQQNLRSSLSEVSAIVITHRIFKEWDFDLICIMEDGQIVEQGTHSELMDLDGKYARLYRYQTESNIAG